MKIRSEVPFFSLFNLISSIIGVIALIPTYLKWKKYKPLPETISIIFDRYHSTIVLPSADQLGHIKIPFKELRAAKLKLGASITQAASRPHLIFYIDPNINILQSKGLGYILMTMSRKYDDAQETWSMYVWYMDKNRPLPPGSAFDEFREKDFERRKAEGFPPPLYKSVVPTVEATATQQQERENYWKDEDYMVDAKEAKYSLLDGFKDFKPKKKEKIKKEKKKKKDKKK